MSGVPDSGLRLHFGPDAIRQHFDADIREDYQRVAEASDDVLREVGWAALNNDELYRVFHEVLVSAAAEMGLIE